MELDSIMDVNLIDLDIKASNKEEVILQLIELMYNNDIIKSKEKFHKAVLKREGTVSTGIGMGIAIPHAKSSSVKSCAIAVGRVLEGVDFDALDGQPAYLIFLIALPEDDEIEDFEMISEISRSLAHMTTREKLLKAKNKQDIIELLKEKIYD